MSRSRIVKPVEERRQEILSTARRLFFMKGYKNTSVADIARELDIAQGLVFHYFKSKALLLYAVFDEIAAEEQEATKAFMTNHRGRAIDCLKLLFEQGSSNHGSEILFEDLADDPAICEYLQDKLSSRSLPLIHELIERGNNDGSWQCDYPAETAVFISQGFSGILKNHKDYDIDLMRAAMQNILVRLLGIDTAPNQMTVWER